MAKRPATPGLPLQPERSFQDQVVKLAEVLGYRVYHTHDSRRSEAGFPDLVLTRRPRVIFAELKRQDKGPTPAQQAWLDDLRASGQAAFLWRPSDWDEIVAVLTTPGDGRPELRERN